MDVNTLRSIATVVSFVTFIGIVWWAYAGRHNSRFQVAAHSVLQDDDLELNDYVVNFHRMFGDPRMDAVHPPSRGCSAGDLHQ